MPSTSGTARAGGARRRSSRVPPIRLRPAIRAVNGVRGCLMTSAVGPDSTIRPSSSTMTRCASSRASSRSWVTMIAGPVGQHLPQHPAQQRRGADVERGQGFVEQQQPGVGGQGPGDRDPLGLPAGQLRRLAGRRTRSAPTSSSQPPGGGCRAPGRAGRRLGARRRRCRARSGAGTAAGPGPAGRPRGLCGGTHRHAPAVRRGRTGPARRARPGRCRVAGCRPGRTAGWTCRRRSGRARRRRSPSADAEVDVEAAGGRRVARHAVDGHRTDDRDPGRRPTTTTATTTRTRDSATAASASVSRCR